MIICVPFNDPAILSITIKDVSIKATTTEKMGFVGRKEGLVAHAACLIEKIIR